MENNNENAIHKSSHNIISVCSQKLSRRNIPRVICALVELQKNNTEEQRDSNKSEFPMLDANATLSVSCTDLNIPTMDPTQNRDIQSNRLTEFMNVIDSNCFKFFMTLAKNWDEAKNSDILTTSDSYDITDEGLIVSLTPKHRNSIPPNETEHEFNVATPIDMAGGLSERISVTLTPNFETPEIGISIDRLDQQDGAKSDIFVTGIKVNSLAEKDGRLQVFDELVEVNTRAVHRIPYEDLQTLFNTVNIPLKLTVHRNSSAAILRKMGYTIPSYNTSGNVKEFELLETKFGQSLSEIFLTELIELECDTRNFGFVVGQGVDENFFVQEIIPGSLAQKDGRLQIGDVILRINDHEINYMTGNKIHQLISSSNELMLLVRHQAHQISSRRRSRNKIALLSQKSTDSETHSNFMMYDESREIDPQALYPDRQTDCVLPETVNIVLQRNEKGSLGMFIKGLIQQNSEDSSQEEGIYVSEIIPGGPAEKNGYIKNGDRIVNVNGNNLKGLKPEQALSIVKAEGNTLYLTLERSLQPIPDLSNSPERSSQTNSPPSHSHELSVIIKSDASDHQLSSEENGNTPSLGIVHEFCLSHLSESTLRFENDPEGLKYSGELSKAEESIIIQEWLPRVGRNKMVFVAQMMKKDGSIGIEVQRSDYSNQSPHEVEGTRTIISKISDGGPAAQNGTLQFGDELLEINGIRVTDIYHEDVIKLLKSVPLHFRIVVCRSSGSSQDTTSSNLPLHYRISHPTNLLDTTSPSDSEDNMSSPNSLEKKLKNANKHQRQASAVGDVNINSKSNYIGENNDDEDIEKKLIQIALERDEADKKVKNLIRQICGNANEYSEEQNQRVLDEIRAKHENKSAKIEHQKTESGTMPRSKRMKGFDLSANNNMRAYTPQPFPKATHNDLTPKNSLPLSEFEGLTKSEEDILLKHVLNVPFEKVREQKNNQMKKIPFPKFSFEDVDDNVYTPLKSTITSESETASSLVGAMLNSEITENINPSHSRSDNLLKKITITKNSDGLGLGLDYSPPDPTQNKPGFVYIKNIVNGSPAWEDGRLQIGDEIIFINNFEVRDKILHAVAVHISNLPQGPVTLTVHHSKEEQPKLIPQIPELIHIRRNKKLKPIGTVLPEQISEKNSSREEVFYSETRLSSDSSFASEDSSLKNSDLYNQIKKTPLLTKRNDERFKLIASPSNQGNRLLDHIEVLSNNSHDDMKQDDMVKRYANKPPSHDDFRSLTLFDTTTAPILDNGAMFDTPKPHFTPPPNYINLGASNKATHSPNMNSPRVGENSRNRVPSTATTTTYNNNNNNKFIPTKSPQDYITKDVQLLRNPHTNNVGISIVHRERQSIDGKFFPKGIYIRSINDPIIRSGQICIDDQILEVNNCDLRYATHEEAVDIINKAKEPVRLLLKQHIVPVSESIQARVDKLSIEMAYLSGKIFGVEFRNAPRGSGIAIEIARTLTTLHSYNYFKVFEVMKGSNAERTNKIKKDDIIININGISAIGIQHSQLVELLRAPQKDISLVLCRLVPELENGVDLVLINDQYSANRQLHPKKRTIKSCTIEKNHQVELNIASFNRNSRQPFIISGVKCRTPSFKRNLKFKQGDELVAINNIALTGYNLDNVQKLLAGLSKTNSYIISFCHMSNQNATPSDITTFIPPHTETHQNNDNNRHHTIDLFKKPGQSIGLTVIDYGEGQYEGVYIKEVLPNGLAATDERIQPGCRIVAVNGIDMTEISANFFDFYADKSQNRIKLTLDYSSMLNSNQMTVNDTSVRIDSRARLNWSSETSLDITGNSQHPHSSNNQGHLQTGSKSKLGIRTVQLTRNQNESYGLTIRGGKGYKQHGDFPLFVGQTYPDRAAAKSGLIQENDVILEINNISTKDMTKDEAIELLKSRTEVTLVLSDENDPFDIIFLSNPDTPNRSSFSSSRESLQFRESLPPPKQPAERKFSYLESKHIQSTQPQIHHNQILTTQPPLVYSNRMGLPLNNYSRPVLQPSTTSSSQNFKIVKLKKDINGWGLSFSGGSDLNSGPQPIRIESLYEGGIAKKDGRLKEGDEILQVNRYSLHNVTHQWAFSILTQAQEDEVTLYIRK